MKKEAKIFDSDVEYTVDFRNVKYPRLEFRTGRLHLILPLNYKKQKELLEKHKRWIKEKEKIIKRAFNDSKDIKIEKRSLEKLRKLIFNYYKNNPYKIKVNRIYFKRMKSKWASCSSKGNLMFNTLLKYLPSSVVKYVVYHELVHLIEKRHNSNFWRMIKKEFKNYEKKEKDLFIYWFRIQSMKDRY